MRMEAGNMVAAEQFLNLSSCQHANRQSNHVATPKPIDNIFNETRGTQYLQRGRFPAAMTANNILSLLGLALLPFTCGAYFFTLCVLGWDYFLFHQ